jgi:hypothetical protein
MFRVIVAGGIALSTAAPGLVVGCGGSVGTLADAGHGGDAFPSEGADARQGDAFPQEGIDASHPVDSGGVSPDAFPSETAQLVDAFPTEGPNLEAGSVDAGPNADAGFPFETAAP